MVNASFSRDWRLLFILIALVAGVLTPPAAYAKNSCRENLYGAIFDPALIAPDFPLRWKQEHGLRVANVFPDLYIAPDIQRMNVGPYQYRMYFTDSRNSIKSAWSHNAFDWHLELGARSVGGHPFLVRLPDGSWRMLYGIPSEIQYAPPNSPNVVLKSAISRDGFNFTPEPCYRVGIGPGLPGCPTPPPPALSFAGHGRIWQDSAGSPIHHMVFSGNLWVPPGSAGPSDLMVAISNDYGFTWRVTDECLVKGAHDPAVIELHNGLKAVIGAHLTEYFFVMFTPDGDQWSPPRALQFYDADGRPMGLKHPDVEKYGGDVTLIRYGDGKFRMFMNLAEPGGGIISFVPYEGGGRDK